MMFVSAWFERHYNARVSAIMGNILVRCDKSALTITIPSSASMLLTYFSINWGMGGEILTFAVLFGIGECFCYGSALITANKVAIAFD